MVQRAKYMKTLPGLGVHSSSPRALTVGWEAKAEDSPEVHGLASLTYTAANRKETVSN